MELFFFDKEVLDGLPKSERSKYASVLKQVVIPQGRPFFLSETGCPDGELDGFCNFLLDPRRASGKTWATYASQIAVFLRFLDKQGKHWKEVSRDDLNLYYTVTQALAAELGITESEAEELADVEAQELTGNSGEMTYSYLFDFTDCASPKLAAKLRKKRGSLQLEVGPSFFEAVQE